MRSRFCTAGNYQGRPKRIEDVRPGCEEKVRWIHEGRVRVIGTFEYRSNMRGSGHLGRWPGTDRDIELFEAVLPPEEVHSSKDSR
jgi:hypothetical protein